MRLSYKESRTERDTTTCRRGSSMRGNGTVDEENLTYPQDNNTYAQALPEDNNDHFECSK